MQPATISREDLLSLLGLAGLSVDRQRKRLSTLSIDHGFPRKLPGLDVWARDLVLAWIETNGGREARAGEARMVIAGEPNAGDAPSNYVRESLRRLEARIGDGFAPAGE